MKRITLNFFFGNLFCLLCWSAAFGQNDCQLPAPESIWLVEQTTTTVEVAWAEVIGATDYQIEAVEVNTGVIVATIFSPVQNVIISGLQPNTLYDIIVRPRCDNHELGASAALRVQTGIIVVDILAQLNCVPQTDRDVPVHTPNMNNWAWYPVERNDFMVLYVDMHGTSQNDGVPIFFDTQFNAMLSGPSMTAGTVSAFSGQIDIQTNTPGGNHIFYQPNNNGNWVLIATFEPYIGNNPHIKISWKQPVTVTGEYCQSGKGKVKSTVDIYPNPVHNWFSVLCEEDSPLWITNLTGELYYEGNLYGSEPIEIDATAWPNGTYILRTIQSDQVFNDLLIKTE